MNSFNDLATSIVLNYSSKVLEEVIDKELHKKNELKNLSNMICKTLELTDFIKDGTNYTLLVEKQGKDTLVFKIEPI